MIIDHTYFIGERNIPGTGKLDVQERLNYFIAKYEPKLLRALLGDSLYAAYKAGIAAGTPDAKWLALKNGKTYQEANGKTKIWTGFTVVDGINKFSLIADYVYFYWMRDNASQSTAIGEVRNLTKESKPVSPEDKMRNAWNSMAEWIWELAHFLNCHTEDYPQWLEHDVLQMLKDFKPLNRLGI